MQWDRNAFVYTAPVEAIKSLNLRIWCGQING